MSEFADYVLEQVIDRMGTDEFDYEMYGSKDVSPTKTCRCCGANELIFLFDKERQKWMLHKKDGSLHKCKKNPYVDREKDRS